MAAGSVVVLCPRSLIKDMDDRWLDESLPGGLAARTGATVIDGLSETLPVRVEPGDSPAGPWTDVLEVCEPLNRHRKFLLAMRGPYGWWVPRP